MTPMSSRTRPIAVATVALLVIAIVAVLVMRQLGAPIGQGPSPSPIASPSAAASASLEPTAAPTTEVETAAALALIESQARDLRGLPDPGIGAPEVITREQLADEVAAILDDEWTPDELAIANRTLQAMGLLTAEQDLRDLSAQLLEGQVLGFYDYTQQRMVVVSDAGLTPEARVTYAHEYTHALQDGAFDAGAELDALDTDDAIGAYQALVEGDATLLMLQWALAHLSADELGQIGTTPLPDTTGIPDWMIQQLQWPYLAGLNLLTTVSGMAVVPGVGGGSDWGAVDDVYADPPASTEQVIHPEKYLAHEEPIFVEAPDVAGLLGDGWVELAPNTEGEAMIAIWLTHLGVGGAADAAAAGWGGDSLTVATGPNDEMAMAWRIAWDAPSDAEEFAAAYGDATLPAGLSGNLVRTGTEVTIVVQATSADLANQLAAALSR
jgi:hypothetical protein